MTRPAVPHQVYRCYDAEDRLVYVGVTSRTIGARMATHRRQNLSVWESTVRIETVRYPNKETAYAAEAEAISSESPLLNVQYNSRRRAPVVVVTHPRSAAPVPQDRASLLALAERIRRHELALDSSP